MADPIPWPIIPMLAKASEAPPKDDDHWALEMKRDGIRLMARVDDGITLVTRNQIDVTPRYPELGALATQLTDRTLLLDGEMVGFDEAGMPSFEALQQRMGLEGGKRVASRSGVPIAYVIFDLLYLDGVSLLGLPYAARRSMLDTLALEGAHWMTSPYSVGGGDAMLATSLEHGFEGLMAKRIDSTYEPGKRPGTWLKVKNHRRQEFVVGGWVPGEGRRSGKIGALVIGYYEGDRFISAGKVGTGFTERRLDELAEMLAPLSRETSPFAGGTVPKETRFVEPQLACEVEFTEWTTRGGQLRHPSFKGLRMDKAPTDVVRE
jgi:bifunctional non-homologous end joining protein LigD